MSWFISWKMSLIEPIWPSLSSWTFILNCARIKRGLSFKLWVELSLAWLDCFLVLMSLTEWQENAAFEELELSFEPRILTGWQDTCLQFSGVGAILSLQRCPIRGKGHVLVAFPDLNSVHKASGNNFYGKCSTPLLGNCQMNQTSVANVILLFQLFSPSISIAVNLQ